MVSPLLPCALLLSLLVVPWRLQLRSLLRLLLPLVLMMLVVVAIILKRSMHDYSPVCVIIVNGIVAVAIIDITVIIVRSICLVPLSVWRTFACCRSAAFDYLGCLFSEF